MRFKPGKLKERIYLAGYSFTAAASEIGVSGATLGHANAGWPVWPSTVRKIGIWLSTHPTLMQADDFVEEPDGNSEKGDSHDRN